MMDARRRRGAAAEVRPTKADWPDAPRTLQYTCDVFMMPVASFLVAESQQNPAGILSVDEEHLHPTFMLPFPHMSLGGGRGGGGRGGGGFGGGEYFTHHTSDVTCVPFTAVFELSSQQ